MSNIFRIQDDLYLDKISFNKETGFVTFHGTKYFKPENLNNYVGNYYANNAPNLNNNSLSHNYPAANQDKKDMIPFRLSRNINVILYIYNFTR
jgi:hypothetical protein